MLKTSTHQQEALEYGKILFQQVYVKLKNQKLEPERLEMLLRWGEDATMLQAKALPPEPMVPQETTIQGGGAETLMAPEIAQSAAPSQVQSMGVQDAI